MKRDIQTITARFICLGEVIATSTETDPGKLEARARQLAREYGATIYTETWAAQSATRPQDVQR